MHSITSPLAFHGGNATFNKTLEPYNSISIEEENAVLEVIRSTCLSGFYGSPGPEFYGGPFVRQLEQQWCDTFGCDFAISLNSNTSGLMASMGAIGISPGDEVIVPPLSMSATAISPLYYGGIPVFCDLDPITCCLDPVKLEKLITPKTKAIIVVNLFGHIAHLDQLRKIADHYNLFLIEDNAQAPLGTLDGKFAGTFGDIGVFSLNYHKHFHCGEGGICVTNSKNLALRLQLIRNHGENCIGHFDLDDISNIVGLNLRMTELSAAVALQQLMKSEKLVSEREHIALRLNEGLAGLDGITLPVQRRNTRPVYYMYQMRYDPDIVGVSRELFASALAAEGFPTFLGFLEPLYLLPIFQKQQAIGRAGWPFSLSNRSYSKGLCPVAERLHETELMGFDCCCVKVTDEDLDLLIQAFRKVYSYRHELIA
jgi:dTDP-4-amino-4,6-dideoxygalactose transaminase